MNGKQKSLLATGAITIAVATSALVGYRALIENNAYIQGGELLAIIGATALFVGLDMCKEKMDRCK